MDWRTRGGHCGEQMNDLSHLTPQYLNQGGMLRVQLSQQIINS
jgi:hypothetical protein